MKILPYNLKVWKCPMCHDEHEIDKYGWIQSCIGYIELGNMINEIEKWLSERLKNVKKS